MMNRKINKYWTVAAALGVLAVGGAMMPRPAMADKSATDVAIVSPLPLPVAGTVNAQQSGNWSVSLVGTPTVSVGTSGNPLPVLLSLPSTAFTIPPQQVSLVVAGSATQPPDPSGTRYAITSVTLSNNTDSNGELRIFAIAFSANVATCGFVANEVARADGPVLTAPPHTTTNLTFPQPYVTAPVSGPHACLTAGGAGFLGMNWSVVGYKL